jgi:hypothetical protein
MVVHVYNPALMRQISNLRPAWAQICTLYIDKMGVSERLVKKNKDADTLNKNKQE